MLKIAHPSCWLPGSAPLTGLLLCCLMLFACSDGSDGGGKTTEPDAGLIGCADTANCASNPPLQIGADRLAEVHIPSDYTPTTRYPLIVVLHGYGGNGAIQTVYLGLDQRVDSGQYVLVVPDGTANANGVRFWNATPACCAGTAAAQDGAGIDYSQIDDVGYIRSLVEEAVATYSIDTRRIGLFGHSNGGFMALRMACESADYITSLISLAGSTFAEADDCAPAELPVSVLLLHGDADATISYDGQQAGGPQGRAYPGALETARRFADLAGCDSEMPVMEENRDVDASIAGPETTVADYPDCRGDIEVQLWTIVEGPHIPGPWVPQAQDSFVDWLLQHPREQ